jgi:hypothetical protein
MIFHKFSPMVSNCFRSIFYSNYGFLGNESGLKFESPQQNDNSLIQVSLRKT